MKKIPKKKKISKPAVKKVSAASKAPKARAPKARASKVSQAKRIVREPKEKPLRTQLKNLKEYREKLMNVKDDLIQQINGIAKDTLMKSQKELSGDISGYSIHMADMATDNYDREFNLGLVSDERKVLLEIDDAVKRIEEKTYGMCPTCRKPIAKTRLNAIPYAKYCIVCQEALEKEERY